MLSELTAPVTKHPAEILCTLITEERKKNLERNIVRYPRKNPIASDIGDCTRQIVHSVLDWDKRSPFDAHGIARMEVGNQREREIVKELMDLGMKIVDGQQSFQIKDPKGRILLSGRIDFKIEYERMRVPVEVKSMAPHIWNSINSLADFEKKSYLRKYTHQLMSYLYHNNMEAGLFLLDDCLGHWKFIFVPLDYEKTELILRRLELAVNHIDAKTYPDRIEYSSEICGKCAFNHVCLPIENITTSGDFLEDGELEALMERRESLKLMAKDYEELDEQIKDRFLKREKVIVGNPPRFIVTGKERSRTSYATALLPKEDLEKIKQTTTFWATKIEPVVLGQEAKA